MCLIAYLLDYLSDLFDCWCCLRGVCCLFACFFKPFVSVFLCVCLFVAGLVCLVAWLLGCFGYLFVSAAWLQPGGSIGCLYECLFACSLGCVSLLVGVLVCLSAYLSVCLLSVACLFVCVCVLACLCSII